MKRMIMTLVAVIGMAVMSYAGNNETAHIAAFDMSTNTEKISTALQLDKNQTDKLEALNEVFCEQIDRVSYADNDAQENLMATAIKTHLNNVKKILTSAQYNKYSELMKESMQQNDLQAYIR